MNPFTERYKSLSNSELVEIVDNSPDYQDEAVDAAKMELANRKLSLKELNEAREELEIQNERSNATAEKIREVETKVLDYRDGLWEKAKSYWKSADLVKRQILIITLLFGCISVYYFVVNYPILQMIFTDFWIDLSVLLFLAPLFILPVAVVLFWLKKGLGWILLTAYLTFKCVLTIGMFIITLNYEPLEADLIDSFFTQPSASVYILPILFYGVMIWITGKRGLRDYFGIDRAIMFGTIGVTVFLTGLILKDFF